jgi:hypothetical protein
VRVAWVVVVVSPFCVGTTCCLLVVTCVVVVVSPFAWTRLVVFLFFVFCFLLCFSLKLLFFLGIVRGLSWLSQTDYFVYELLFVCLFIRRLRKLLQEQYYIKYRFWCKTPLNFLSSTAEFTADSTQQSSIGHWQMGW